MTNLLWRDLIGAGSHVDLLINIHTGDDEEDAWEGVRLTVRTGLVTGNTWAPGSPSQQSPQSEYHGSLVLLHQVL